MLGVEQEAGEQEGRRGDGAGPVELGGRTEEVDLGRICSEELIKVSKEAAPAYPHMGGGPVQQYHPYHHPQLPHASPKDVCPYESSCSIAKECRVHGGRCGMLPTKLAESYYGYVETVEDAVMIVEACRFGRLMRVKRRLLDKERQGIRSGSVFVFVERESGIRRWTDGKVWSPSRICGEFLIYRELESRQPPASRKAAVPPPAAQPQVNWTEQVARILAVKAKTAEDDEPAAKHRRLEEEAGADEMTEEQKATTVANIRMALAAAAAPDEPGPAHASPAPSAAAPKSMIFKKDGLIKKTISLTVAEETYHLICYFKDSNLGSELLHLTPSRMTAFKNLDVCRNPTSYPIAMLQPGHGHHSGTTNPIPPAYYNQRGGVAAYAPQQQQYYQQPMPMTQISFVRQGRQPPLPAQTIANGSVQLPPMRQPVLPAAPRASHPAGLANLLGEPGSPPRELAAGGCGGCPQACVAGKTRCGSDKENLARYYLAEPLRLPEHEPGQRPEAARQQQAAALEEEEQLLFCHFVESVQREGSA